MSNYVAGGPLAAFFEEPATVWTPRMGSAAMDSAGILAGVNRALRGAWGCSARNGYCTSIPCWAANRNSLSISEWRGRTPSYWNQTEALTANVVRFLMRIEAPPAPHVAARLDRHGGRARQAGLRGPLRQLPFQQIPRAAGGRRSRKLLGQLPGLLESLLDVDQAGRVPQRRCRSWCWPTISWKRTTSRPICAFRLPLVGTNACIALGEQWRGR